MALRRAQAFRPSMTEPNTPPVNSPVRVHSRDTPGPEELPGSTIGSQSSTPIPASNGSVSGDDSIHDESPIQPVSMEEDSLSEYDNVRSEEEEEQDHEEDEELRTDADGMTYYVHCCPEDESYMEGMDCHEGADSTDRPGTSRDPHGGRKPVGAWAHSEGFYEVLQQDKELIYKRPEPITEATYIQAPMAEDEEDEEEAEEIEDDEYEEEEEEEEEDGEQYFVYEGERAEEDQDEILPKSHDFPKVIRNPHRDSSQAESREGEDFPKGQDTSIPENSRDNTQLSLSGQKEGMTQATGDDRADYERGFEMDSTDRNRTCKGGGGVKVTKNADPENRVEFKKTDSCKENRDKEVDDRHLNEDSGCPEDSIGRRERRAPSIHRAEARRDGQVVASEGEVDHIVNGVRATLKVGPKTIEMDGAPVEKSCAERGAPNTFGALSMKSHRRENGPAAPDAAMQPPNPQTSKKLQKDLTTSTKEEGLRSSQEQQGKINPSFPSFVDGLYSGLCVSYSVPGPCEPEDLIDGIIFAANYLGSTQILSDRNPSKSVRMMQAQEAVDRVKSLDGETQSLTEVDLFISTKAIKVLNADTQETMMDNALRTISYIADIGSVVVLMARRRMSHTTSLDCTETSHGAAEGRKQYRMICYVFESEDAQLIAQSIGQAFSMAYQEFLRANGINPKDLSQKDYSDILNTPEMYNDDLIHFSNSENCKQLHLEKQKGEILGVVIVESGWGSILPTVILACMLNSGPAARSGKLSVGDQIMAVNDTSLVGLPLATCQSIIKSLKGQVQLKLSVVSCPPVTTVLIKRPDLQYQLGFSVQNGIICSLMRGGIAERGGVRVGHRIIEINGQSVVAMAHEKIVHALSVSAGEIHMKTMPAVMFRLLTGQETPVYI
ncbi:amyloid-beta A4 precursor protein-binding family A member 2 isoform X1 [Electrophorus electricus]|uniref:amyloid-beta A4 precursor protein-binding family A member 2 isoform X1 n=1 Tax=Electrophorus electricus TaxID=8005 RepID=UPI0015CFC985|nr:amyloid-beta A4 precursor protein-binding family A member 2 isoform X1 [Electrophorus electricus]XP_026876562.2 amyloid-beta A4 precursor protein-binding family A member 2 isoform X1 [Electrophorus electricus]